ncbi:MAG: hypothetical protein PHV13_03625 [Candidatus ainarchaeum sp.]|nr:hypothetical protein [Candidatus ainarchaeum sp.]
MRAVPVMLIALLAFMLAAGCLSRIYSTQQYTTDYQAALRATVPIADSDETMECKEANCICMVCKRGTSIFPWLTSYVGGSCFFKKDCTSAELSKLALGTSSLGKDITLNYFRVGQGPSFSDFGDANAYCSDRMGMAVQWLLGGEGEPYALPTARRAICLLDKGVLPVYVLYSGGKNIDAASTAEIAEILGTEGKDVTGGRLTDGPVGPVIVTTEINYDASQAALIKEQVRAINTGCRNDRAKNDIHCLVAVAPRLGDKAALDAVMLDPSTGEPDSEMADAVDLIAYGVDSNRANLDGYCDTPSVLWDRAMEFSGYTLYTLGKPSIIPYVLFDAAGTDANPDSGKMCKWTEATMIEGYKPFFSRYAYAMPGRGVIGVAPYSFKSSSFGINNPLGCSDCDIGKNNQRLTAWYAGCQAYVTLSRKATSGIDNFPASGTLLRFDDQLSGSCQDETNDIVALFLKRGYGNDKNFMTPQTPTLQQPAGQTLIRCDECVSQKTTIPFNFIKVAVPASTCDSMPELDSFAGQRSLDPMFVRAIVYGESSFDQCAAAKVCSASCRSGATCTPAERAGCFPTAECYDMAYKSITDPTGTCTAKLPNSDGTKWRWCGLGLMQSLEPPVDYWPAQYREDDADGQYVSVYQDAKNRKLAIDLEIARACNPTSFNPFNPSDSACAGTAKLANMMREAQKNVRDYHNDRGTDMLGWKDTDKDSVFAAYIAANRYTGTWTACVERDAGGACVTTRGRKWIDDFYYNGLSVTEDTCNSDPVPKPECSSRGVPNRAECYGIKDPIEYIRCRISLGNSDIYDRDPGARTMGIYFYLRDNCKNSFCPDYKRLYEADKAAGGTGKPVVIPPDVDPLGG